MIDTNKVKARILELGLTQSVVAKEMGINQGTLSLKISNQRPMDLAEAEVLQKILNIPDQDFKVYFFSRVGNLKTAAPR